MQTYLCRIESIYKIETKSLEEADLKTESMEYFFDVYRELRSAQVTLAGLFVYDISKQHKSNLSLCSNCRHFKTSRVTMNQQYSTNSEGFYFSMFHFQLQ